MTAAIIVLAVAYAVLAALVMTRPTKRITPQDFADCWAAVDSNGVFRPERVGRPVRRQPQADRKAPHAHKGGRDAASC